MQRLGLGVAWALACAFGGAVLGGLGALGTTLPVWGIFFAAPQALVLLWIAGARIALVWLLLRAAAVPVAFVVAMVITFLASHNLPWPGGVLGSVAVPAALGGFGVAVAQGCIIGDRLNNPWAWPLACLLAAPTYWLSSIWLAWLLVPGVSLPAVALAAGGGLTYGAMTGAVLAWQWKARGVPGRLLANAPAAFG